MERYQGEFENTRKYVYEKTGRYTQTTVRTIIIAVLLLLVVGAALLKSYSWSIVWNFQSAKANICYSSYSKKLDQYLEDEDYVMLNQFCDQKEIRYYNGTYAEEYGLVIPMSLYYVELCQELFRYYNFDESGYYTKEYVVSSLNDNLGYFYAYAVNRNGTIDEDRDGYNEKYLKAASTMSYNVERILVTYCGFTQEEAEALPELSQAKTMALLEEKLEERLEGGQQDE
jgi:hypothetical protein